VFQFLLVERGGGERVAQGEVLSAPLVLEYPFRRTVGPVQSAFLTGLREGVVLGIRTGDGRVMCPPVEYDPVTGDDLDELVTLGETGTVTTWSWEPEPRPNQPLDRPFAWALIRLDGADTAMLHAVDAGTPDRISTGAKVRIRWADEREGAITDITCFEVTR
jgi:uncharacterized OB-fold protein